MNIAGAHEFEQSYKVNSSIADDPFYTVPADSAASPAGTVIKVESETDTSRYCLPPNLALSRFLYQSKKSNGSLVPASALVLWPYDAQKIGDKLPMVVWAHGTSGILPECAPSNMQNLWHNFQTLFQLALYGYVVVAPDYAGLGVGKDAEGKSITHEYLTGLAQANDIFYSIQAAQQAFSELTQEFVVLGHSQGGGAVWAFAEKLVQEPLAGYLGTVPIAPVTRLLDYPVDEPIMPLVVLFLVPNLSENFGLNPEDILTTEGLRALETLKDLKGCMTIAIQLIGAQLIKEGWQNHTAVQAWQNTYANGRKPFRGPMLIVEGDGDPAVQSYALEAAIMDTIQQYPDSQLQYHVLPGVTHAPALYAGLRVYMDWVAARFQGIPAQPGYRQSKSTPIRPGAGQQTETNWFIQKQTQGYQLT